MSRLRSWIKSHEKIYFMARILQQFRNPDFRSRVLAITDSPAMVKIERLGEKNPDKLFYLIELQDCGLSGLFALLNDTVKRLELARRLGATPYVLWRNTSYCPEGNAFEKYFLQLTDISYEDILQSQNVIISRQQDGFERDCSQVYYEQSGYLQAIGALYKKYIHLRPEIKAKFENDLQNSGLSDRIENSIGVHFRGTDFRQSLAGHPKYIPYEDYVPVIKDFAGEKFAGVFLCTDDDNALEYFKNVFKDSPYELLYYSDTMRSKDDFGLHYENFRSPEKNRDIGYEVIRDVYTLAKCKMFISGVSNVSFTARAINAADKKPFEKVKVFDLGLNVSGVTSKVFNENFNKLKK